MGSREHRRVLNYLSDMMEMCRRLHRSDIESEYREAWEVTAQAIYGDLPPRVNQGAGIAPPSSEPKPKTLPTYRKQMLEKPFRKIIARIDDFEVLECGHRFWVPLHDESAKRRRCADCAMARKKPEGVSASEKAGIA
jgi:hypothetical protein